MKTGQCMVDEHHQNIQVCTCQILDLVRPTKTDMTGRAGYCCCGSVAVPSRRLMVLTNANCEDPSAVHCAQLC